MTIESVALLIGDQIDLLYPFDLILIVLARANCDFTNEIESKQSILSNDNLPFISGVRKGNHKKGTGMHQIEEVNDDAIPSIFL